MVPFRALTDSVLAELMLPLDINKLISFSSTKSVKRKLCDTKCAEYEKSEIFITTEMVVLKKTPVS
jgi:hypothetical protein